MNKSGMDNLKSYLNLIHKKNNLFVLTAMIFITAFIVAAYVLPKKYEAKSTVFIEKNVISNLVEGVAVSPSLDERLSVLSYSMKSRHLLLKVFNALDLDIETKDQSHLEALVDKFRKSTDIEIVSNKNNRSSDGMDLFIVSFTHKNPTLARDYINTLVNLYIEENLSAKRKESHTANSFLVEQIDFFKKKLDKIDKEVIRFRTEKGIFVSMDESRIVQEIEEAGKELDDIKIRQMELAAMKTLISKNLEKESVYTVAMFGTGTRGTVKDRILMLESELNNLLMDYTEHYPEVLRIRKEIQNLKNTESENGSADIYSSVDSSSEMSTLNPVYQELKKELSRVEIDIAAINTKERYLNDYISTKKEYMREIPAEKKILADLEREMNSTKRIYEELVMRLGQSEVSMQMEIQDKGATFRIVDPAILPTLPVSPNRIKIILLGIFAGLAGAFALILFMDKIDHTVKKVDTVKALGLPVLGMVPRIRIPEEIVRKRKKDIKIYAIASFYMFIVLGVFAFEVIAKHLS